MSPAENIPKEQIVKCARELCEGSEVSHNGLCRYTHKGKASALIRVEPRIIRLYTGRIVRFLFEEFLWVL